MRFQRLDLNLLVALDALLSERSVSLAADRICLSQSATSSALGRLRDYFQDDLLVLKGRQMVLTARGEELIEPVRAVLQQIRTTIAVAPDFDPMTSDRAITIMASDYAAEVLLAPALKQFAESAPNMRFDILAINDCPNEALERGTIDLLMTIDYAMSGCHPSERLFDDDYVVIGCKSNSMLTGGLTQDMYFRLGHVAPRFGGTRVPSFEEWFMGSQSMQRRIEVGAPSFLAIPFMVVGTDRIATIHRRLAEKMVKFLPLLVLPVPFAVPSIREAVQWHSSNAGDKALKWVVGELKRIAALMDERCEKSAVPDFVVRNELGKSYQASTHALTRH